MVKITKNTYSKKCINASCAFEFGSESTEGTKTGPCGQCPMCKSAVVWHLAQKKDPE